MEKEFDYKCRFCATVFNDLNEITKHLKSAHNVKQGKGKIYCCVNRSSCPSYFLSFSGLKNHVNKCAKTRYDDDKLHLEEIQNELHQLGPSNPYISTEVQANTFNDVRITTNTQHVIGAH